MARARLRSREETLMLTRNLIRSTCCALLLLGSATVLGAGEAEKPVLPSKDDVVATVARAQAWLLARANEDGSFAPAGMPPTPRFGLGMTVLAVDSMVGGPGGVDRRRTSASRKAVAYGCSSTDRPTASIYSPGSRPGELHDGAGASGPWSGWAMPIDQATIDRGDRRYPRTTQNGMDADCRGLRRLRARFPQARRRGAHPDRTGGSRPCATLACRPMTRPCRRAAMFFARIARTGADSNDQAWAKQGPNDGGAVSEPRGPPGELVERGRREGAGRR